MTPKSEGGLRGHTYKTTITDANQNMAVRGTHLDDTSTTLAAPGVMPVGVMPVGAQMSVAPVDMMIDASEATSEVELPLPMLSAGMAEHGSHLDDTSTTCAAPGFTLVGAQMSVATADLVKTLREPAGACLPLTPSFSPSAHTLSRPPELPGCVVRAERECSPLPLHTLLY